MDKVDSSVGHQVSYLRKWAPRAYNTMKMAVPRLIIDDKQHQVYQKDIFDLANDVEVDLAYYDPPYGSSNELMPPSRVRYASYYHIWKTICLNDKPKLVGVANRREDVGDTISGSIFEEFRKNNEGQYIVIEAIEKLIKDTPAKYVVLSYNNNGRATFQAIKDILKNLKKKISIFEMDYKKNVMATITRTTNEWVNDTNGKNKEYLFLIHKNGKTETMPEIKVEKIDIRNWAIGKSTKISYLILWTKATKSKHQSERMDFAFALCKGKEGSFCEPIRGRIKLMKELFILGQTIKPQIFMNLYLIYMVLAVLNYMRI